MAGPALALALALPVSPARGEDAAVPGAGLPAIELQTLLREARHKLPTVLSALATLQRIQAEQAVAEGAYLPRLTGEASLSGVLDNRRLTPDVRVNSGGLGAVASANLDWTVVDASRRNEVAAARLASQAQRAGVESSERLAMIGAVELYLRSLAAAELVDDAKLTLERRTQEHATVTDLATAGLRPQVDAARAGVEATAARYVLATRRVEADASFAALAAAIGRAPERGLRPSPLIEESFAGPSGIDEISRLAQAHRPELKQLREQLRVQEQARAAAMKNRMPTAGLFANGQASYYEVLSGEGIQGDQYFGTGGMYLRWAGADPSVVRQGRVASARIAEAQRNLEATTLSVRAEAVDSAYSALRAHAQLEQASQVLEAARVTRVAQLERYGAGMATLLELLDAEALEQTARRSRIEARRDYQLARARVLAACGIIGELAR